MFSRFFKKFSQRTPRSSQRRILRPQLELLEKREVLSGNPIAGVSWTVDVGFHGHYDGSAAHLPHARDFEVTIRWGDGQKTVAANVKELQPNSDNFMVEATHVYKKAGNTPSKFEVDIKNLRDPRYDWVQESHGIHVDRLRDVLANELQRGASSLTNYLNAKAVDDALFGHGSFKWLDAITEPSKLIEGTSTLIGHLVDYETQQLDKAIPGDDFLKGFLKQGLADSAGMMQSAIQDQLPADVKAKHTFELVAEIYDLGKQALAHPEQVGPVLAGLGQQFVNYVKQHPKESAGKVAAELAPLLIPVAGEEAEGTNLLTKLKGLVSKGEKGGIAALEDAAHALNYVKGSPGTGKVGPGGVIKIPMIPKGLAAQVEKAIQFKGPVNALYKSLVKDIGGIIGSDPVAARAFEDIQQGGVQIILDTRPGAGIKPEGYVLGEFDPDAHKILIHVDAHIEHGKPVNPSKLVGDLVTTIVHESKHVKMSSAKNSLYEEYFARLRESLLQNGGKRPSETVRGEIWRTVIRDYYGAYLKGDLVDAPSPTGWGKMTIRPIHPGAKP